MITEFKSILELMKAFPTKQACIDYLEYFRWKGNIVSPFDPTSKVYKCKLNRYRCKNTGKYFNVRTKTLFDNSKISLQKWFFAIWVVNSHKKGISSIQLGKDIGISQKSSWFMLQRIRACFGLEAVIPEMTDNTQMDETFIGGKNKNRHKHKKVENSHGRSFKDKSPVLGMLSNGLIRAQVIEDTTSVSLHPVVLKYVPKGTTIVSDEWRAYAGLNKHYEHQIVDHKIKQFVNDCGFTTNGIEGFWSLLKRGIFGIYHYTSKKHLQKYIDEFVYRYNTRHNTESGKFNLFMANTEYRLTYKALIQK